MKPDLIRPILTVDVVLLTLQEGRMHVVLLRREHQPHAGRLALVGGYVRAEQDESTSDAAARVIREKTGLKVRLLEQLMTFSGNDRDPRGWSASVAYYALMPSPDSSAFDGGRLASVPLREAKGLPFDHDAIVAKAADRWRRRAAYSTLPAFLLPPQFTLPELRAAYEVVLGRALNDSAFRRKLGELRIVAPVEGAKSIVTDRPAQLYRLAAAGIAEFDRTL
ncbi:MAG: NUDIX hydrolase [Rhodoplanes sp.]|nr:NUDIX hydrolase [Rhodoplanes sp.]